MSDSKDIFPFSGQKQQIYFIQDFPSHISKTENNILLINCINRHYNVHYHYVCLTTSVVIFHTLYGADRSVFLLFHIRTNRNNCK